MANKTTTFAQDVTVWAIVSLANAPDDTTLKAVWYAVDAENNDPNTKIDEVPITTRDGKVPFSLVNNGF